jgi:hypothetical protein
MQLPNELGRRDIGKDLGFLAERLQESYQPPFRTQWLDQPFPPPLSVRQPALVGQPQEESHQPLGKTAADQQQVALLQFAEKPHRHMPAARHDVVGVLENVLGVDGKHRRRPGLAEHIEQLDLALARLPVARQVGTFARRQVWRVDDLVHRAASPQTTGKQVVGRQRHQQPKVGNRRDLADRLGGSALALGRQLVDDVVDIRVEILEVAVMLDPADGVVQFAEERQRFRLRVATVKLEQAPRHPSLQPIAAAGASEQLPTDNRYHETVLDRPEQPVPRPFVHRIAVPVPAKRCGLASRARLLLRKSIRRRPLRSLPSTRQAPVLP